MMNVPWGLSPCYRFRIRLFAFDHGWQGMFQKKRIALLLPQDVGYSRAVLRGVQTFAISRPNWVFRDAPPVRESLKPLREWRPDGIIALLFDREVASALRRMRKPLVNTTSTLDLPKVPLVENDHYAIGRMAAGYFLKLGFRNFGYFGSQWMGSSIARRDAFREGVEEAGHSVSTCHGEYLPRPAASDSWVQVDRRIGTWLRKLDKPVAILAQNDVPARDLADRCRMLGLNVPDEVALLGVDNDELECHLCNPTLSSIAVPGQRIGIEAAQLLDRMLRGQKTEPVHRYFPPVRVVVRQSTDTLNVEDEVVAAALRMIHERATFRLAVEDLVAHLSISRRQIERRFRERLGTTPSKEIRRVRVERAKKLLLETDLNMPQVARGAGFTDARRLSVVFKEQTGQSPARFRFDVRGGGDM